MATVKQNHPSSVGIEEPVNDSTPIEVINNQGAHRFEVELEGAVAYLDYRRAPGDKLVLVHTEVPRQFQGRGVAAKLAQAALEYARQSRLRVVPRCEFVLSYLRRNPQYMDLVDSPAKSG